MKYLTHIGVAVRRALALVFVHLPVAVLILLIMAVCDPADWID